MKQTFLSTKGREIVAGRITAVGFIAVLLSSLVAPAAGATVVETGWNEETGIYEMVFPVAGETEYEDNYGACRAGCSRRHEGIDIMADKMIPVVAVASGTVVWIRDGIGTDCCVLSLEHDDGWRSWYVHLNNDTPGTDDGRGFGIAPGIERGAHVEAGQLLGWVGDSGNAETTPPHLHFELIRPNGREINPYRHLRAAEERALESIAAAGDGSVEVFIEAVQDAPPEDEADLHTLIWSHPTEVLPR